jgi:predicted outer membrane protein
MRIRLTGAGAASLALALAAAPSLAQTPRTTTTTTVTQNGEISESWSTAPGANALLAAMHTDAHAMGLLHRSNQGEIDAGSFAQSRAQNADVRAFAAQMVRDHTQLDQQGNALAARLGLTPMLPDSALPNMQMREMRRLVAVGTPSNDVGGGGRVTGRNPAPIDTVGIPGGTSGAPMTRANRGAVAASAGGAMGTDAAGKPVGAASDATGAAFDLAYVRSQVFDHERTLAIIDAAIAQSQSADLRAALQTQVRPAVASHLEMAHQLMQKLSAH